MVMSQSGPFNPICALFIIVIYWYKFSKNEYMFHIFLLHENSCFGMFYFSIVDYKLFACFVWSCIHSRFLKPNLCDANMFSCYILVNVQSSS
jgi:hypothetical protein